MLFLTLLLVSADFIVNGCTTFVIGKSASADGSVFTTHTNDGGGATDPRLVKLPARDFSPGSFRPIWR